MQISFPAGSIKRISRDGEENIQFPDGTKKANQRFLIVDIKRPYEIF